MVFPVSLRSSFPQDGIIPSEVKNVGIGEGRSYQNGLLVEPSQNGHACKPFNKASDFSEEFMVSESPFFLLVKRGKCSFAQKISNAQQIGAQVLIISDFKDQSREKSDKALGN